MELVEQHVPPMLLEHGSAVTTGDGGERFGVVQLALDHPVVLLDRTLRRVRALMGLEIELADVGVRHVERLEVLEECPSGRVLDARQPAQILLASEQLQMDLPRAAAAVAGTVNQQRGVERALRILPHALQQSVGRGATVVVALRWHVHQHARSIDALPVEGAVWKVGDLVPGELDGLEPVHSALLQNLRQVAVVAEGVGQPAQSQLFVAQPELLLQEAPADERLPNQGLAPGDVGVRLHPERTLQLDAPVGDRGFDAFEDGGLLVLHPVQLLRLAGAVQVAVAIIDRVQRPGVCARGLAVGFAQWPQPRHVQVSVPDGAIDEVAIGCRGQRCRERRAGASHLARREARPGATQTRAELGLECGVLGCGSQHEEREVVVVQTEDLFVTDRQPGAVVDAAAVWVEQKAVVCDVGVELDATR